MPRSWPLHTLHALALALPLAATGCVGIGGETIALSHEKLSPPTKAATGPLAMSRAAEDGRDKKSRIGRATFTVFAITSGNIKTQRPITDEVAGQVADALRTAGYEVNLVDGASQPGATSPVLVVKIEEFYFRNYNWLWPIVPTWGDIKLGLRVERPDDTYAFTRSVTGDGNSLCLLGECAFRNATKEAMTEALNKVTEVVTSDEFRTAMEIGAEASESAPAP